MAKIEIDVERAMHEDHCLYINGESYGPIDHDEDTAEVLKRKYKNKPYTVISFEGRVVDYEWLDDLNYEWPDRIEDVKWLS